MGTMGRRQVLRGASAAVGGAAVAGLGLASPASAQDITVDLFSGLTGSWKVNAGVDEDPQQRTELVASFAAGGVLISYAISPSGLPFIGSWEREDTGGFRGELWSGYPAQGNPHAPVTSQIKVTEGLFKGSTISGRYTLTDYAAGGNAVQRVTGTFSGERIKP